MITQSIVDIGKGEPDFPTPDHIKRAAFRAIEENFTKYTPQPGIPPLREACAAKFRTENGIDVDADGIVVSCGGKHSVANAIRATVRKDDEVVMCTPFWFAYPPLVELQAGNSKLVEVREENGFAPDPDDVRNAITGKTRLLILNSPNNPTTAVYSKELLLELGRIALERDCYILCDEVYEKLVFGDAHHVSLASLDAEIARRTITVNSVSKTHAMTGWRIGYAALPRELVALVTRIQEVTTSAPSAICQRAALEALTGDQSHVEMMVASYRERRQLMLDRLARFPMLHAIPPQGTFYFMVSVANLIGKTIAGRVIKDSADVATALRESAGVSVVPGVPFGAPHQLRLSFAVSRDAIDEAFDRLEHLLL
jgi:aspartate aminotransferase